MKFNDISDAIVLLSNEFAKYIDELNQEGARRFYNSDHVKAQALLLRVKKVKLLEEKICALKSDWVAFENSSIDGTNEEKKKVIRKKKINNHERSAPSLDVIKGLILSAISQLNGSGHVQDILVIIEDKLVSPNNQESQESMFSNLNRDRLRYNTYNARSQLINDGFLSSNSPKGIWELTSKGWQLVATKQINPS